MNGLSILKNYHSYHFSQLLNEPPVTGSSIVLSVFPQGVPHYFLAHFNSKVYPLLQNLLIKITGGFHLRFTKDSIGPCIN